MMWRGALLAAVALPLAAQIFEVQWTLDLGEPAVGPPVHVGKPDSTDAIAVALRSGKIAVIGPGGERLRELRLDLAPGSPPVAGEAGEIFAADVWGSVYCFTAGGERRWKYERQDRFGSGYNYLVLDGQREVLVTTQRGNLYAIGYDGRLRFDLHATNFRLSTPAVGDIGGDGVPEIVFGDEDGRVYCLNRRGDVLWISRLANGRLGRALPLIADARQDGRYQVYVPVNSSDAGPGLAAFDAATGKPLWMAPSRMQAYNSTVIADLDGDGRNEILFGDKHTRLYALDASGKRKWEVQLGGRGLFYAPAVADRGSGYGVSIFQVVRGAGPEGRSLYALDGAGKLLDSAPLPGGGVSSPILCRFRGQPDIRLVAAGGSGRLVCYRLPQKSGAGRIIWPGTRNDGVFSGFVRSAQAVHSGARTQPSALPSPTRRAAVKGRNEVTLPGGPANSIAAFRVRDPGGAVHLELAAPASDSAVAFQARQAGDYHADVRWLDAASGRSLGGERIIYTLDAEDSEDLRQVAAFQKAVAGLSLGKHAGLAGYFAALARAFPEQRRPDRPYWLALLRYLAKKPPREALLAQQIMNPWPDLRGFEETGRPPNRIEVSMLGNEYESAAMALTNLAPRDVTVHFQCGAFQNVPARRILEIREVPLIRVNSAGRASEDVLPRLGEGQTLRLAAGETRKVWFTFHSRDLAPGTYRSTLRVGDLLSLDPPLEIEVVLSVRPVRLPDQRAFRHINWLYPGGIRDADVLEKTLQDALAHGTNVFVIPPVTLAVTADGKPGPADTDAHDKLVQRLKGKAVFLISGSVGLRWPAGAKPDTATSEAAYAEAVRWYGRHMDALGVARKDWAFYLHDEPGLTGNDANFQKWVEQVKQVKAADARAQVYANPTGGATAEMLRRVAGLVDIWQPGLDLVRNGSPDLRAIFRQRTYWHYEAPGEQRELSPLGYYRMKPWVAFQLGMTGAGYWVYSSADYWFFDRTMATEYGTVYTTENGPVTTKRWEAWRDGVEDFELLSMLEHSANRVGGAGGRRALQLIHEAVAFVTRGQENASDIGRKFHLYAPDFAPWMAYRDRLIEAQERLSRP